MTKAILLDVDGTLIDYRGQTPATAKEAIRLARAKGHRVYICTGCSKKEVRLRDLPDLDGMILANGAYIEVEDQVIVHNSLHMDALHAILTWLDQNDLAYYMEANSGLYCNQRMLELGPKTMEQYALGKGKPAQEAQSSATSFIRSFEWVAGEERFRSDINKISFILRSYDDYLQAKRRFPDLAVHTWGGVGHDALFGDIGIETNKQEGVECLLSYTHIAKQDAIAFGDASVDLPMFAACGYCVAMGNASIDVKKAADFITGDVDQDGLWQAFVTLGLVDDQG